MKFNEIRARACESGINMYRRKKTDLISVFQKGETIHGKK